MATIEMTTAITRESTTAEVAAWCRDKGLAAEVVGKWVWITFDEKPSAELRAELKAAGFRWVPSRGRWAHACGVRSRRNGKVDPRIKYGAVPVTDYQGDAEE